MFMYAFLYEKITEEPTKEPNMIATQAFIHINLNCKWTTSEDYG